MSTPALPLQGARKKAERRPRNEGVMKRRGIYYARIYPPGSKRAVYRTTNAREVATAELLLPSIRAAVLRESKGTSTSRPEQPSLL